VDECGIGPRRFCAGRWRGKMTEVPTSMATDIMGRGGDATWEYPFGTTFPGYYAMIANAHMAEFGTTEEQLAGVAVKNHYYGSLNPYAHMQKASPWIRPYLPLRWLTP